VPIVVLPGVPNRGFAAGNNLGLYALPARYICLLNNDALVEPETLAHLVAFMDHHPRVGACAPRLAQPDGAAQPYSYGDDPSPSYLLRRALARRRGAALHEWDGALPRRVDWVAFTCALLRPHALDQAGVLDERIFMYFEDNELCLQLRRRGWRVYFVPNVQARHFNAPSYADYRRRADYAAGLARLYRRRYGRLAGLLMGLAGHARLLPEKAASRR
jgi:GT2 family glycosyltransferase